MQGFRVVQQEIILFFWGKKAGSLNCACVVEYSLYRYIYLWENGYICLIARLVFLWYQKKVLSVKQSETIMESSSVQQEVFSWTKEGLFFLEDKDEMTQEQSFLRKGWPFLSSHCPYFLWRCQWEERRGTF